MFEEAIGLMEERTFVVKFDLSFATEEGSIKPCSWEKRMELKANDKFSRDEITRKLEAQLRHFIAGINEYPEDIVVVKVTDFHVSPGSKKA